MSEHICEKVARGEAKLVATPKAQPKVMPRHQVESDRNFELPTRLYVATAGLYMTFLAVMWGAFANPELAIPMVIFSLFVVAGFGTPAIWTRLKGNTSASLTWDRFAQCGIQTATGRCTVRDAVLQMLILPVLIVCWGISVAIIVALVS